MIHFGSSFVELSILKANQKIKEVYWKRPLIYWIIKTYKAIKFKDINFKTFLHAKFNYIRFCSVWITDMVNENDKA
jgi:hypothetical protein